MNRYLYLKNYDQVTLDEIVETEFINRMKWIHSEEMLALIMKIVSPEVLIKTHRACVTVALEVQSVELLLRLVELCPDALTMIEERRENSPYPKIMEEFFHRRHLIGISPS